MGITQEPKVIPRYSISPVLRSKSDSTLQQVSHFTRFSGWVLGSIHLDSRLPHVQASVCGQVAGDGTTSTEMHTVLAHLEYIVEMQAQTLEDSMLYSTCTTQRVHPATRTSGPTTPMVTHTSSPSHFHQ